jgi:MFS transporter, ACS family, inner membrane transport protein
MRPEKFVNATEYPGHRCSPAAETVRVISSMVVVEDLLDRSVGSARRRLLPFLLFMYIASFLDRANIGFAKQALQSSTGISEAAYALGAGLFFLTYAFFEIPSNLILHRIGARVWLSRIMVTWGLISAATMFASGETSFCLLRLLLGAAEAGFFPGVILYLTYWFPNRIRGQILGLFYFGAPLAFILGAPLSGWLLDLGGTAGLQGWQWMFLVEGLAATGGGIAAFYFLDDKPEGARWLPDQEKKALLAELSLEDAERRTHGPSLLFAALKDVRALYFALIYFVIQIGVYGVVFYLPTQVAAILGESIGLRVGLVSAVPWVCALGSAFWLSRIGDRRQNHRQLAAGILVAAGLASFVFPTSGPSLAFVALCVAASGFIAVQPVFWTFPTGYLSGTGAAAGIAMINALGNVGGFVAPNIKVWAEFHFGSRRAGLYVLAAITFLGAWLIAAMRDPKSRWQARPHAIRH